MPTRRRIAKWLLRAALILGAWFLVHSALISWDGFADSDLTGEPADAAVVLGNAVASDGTPRELLRSRLDKTLELYRSGRMRNIVCSGGVGPNGVPEGDAMRADLVAKGVDPAAIMVDNAGKDSNSTAVNANRLFAERNWRTVLIVSNFAHISRCKLAFRHAGLSEVKSAHANFAWRDFKAFPHEFAGYYYYLMRSY